jgi:hypothetical protein
VWLNSFVLQPGVDGVVENGD